MRICLLGDCSGNIDEGMKGIIANLSKELTRFPDIEILLSNPLNFSSIAFWKNLSSFNPDIIHYVPGPSLRSLSLMKIIRVLHSDREKKFIMSATFPQLDLIPNTIIRILSPDIIIAQSERYRRFFQEINIDARILPMSGVNINKFIPSNEEEKIKLRKKYEIETGSTVILHVGHLKYGRNLLPFIDLQKEDDIQIVLVGSTSTSSNAKLIEELRKEGCKIFTEYYSQIEDFYKLADCYFFPTIDTRNCIEIPTSVLEAMACNLPVISTKFGALPALFNGSAGICFLEDFKDLRKKVNDIIDMSKIIENRTLIYDYSWSNVALNLYDLYKEISGL